MDRQIIATTRRIKCDYMYSNLISSLADLITITRSVQNVYYDVYFPILLEENFDEYVLLRIKGCKSRDQDELTCMMEFLVACTDRSKLFCEQLSSRKQFKETVVTLVKRDGLREEVLFQLICIINNITFNYDDEVFRDGDIKEFLVKSCKDNLKCYCVVILLRLCSTDEINQWEDLICNFVPELVYHLEKCCASEYFQYEYSRLEEVLKHIEALCKCPSAKEMLAHNFTLLFKLRLIFTDDRFSAFVDQTKDLVTLIFSAEQREAIFKESNIL